MAKKIKYVGLGEEATALTEASSKNIYMDVIEFEAGQNQIWENGGGVATSHVSSKDCMAADATPRFIFPIGPESGIGWILKWFLGDPTTTSPGTTARQHVYKSDDDLKTFTVFTGSEDLEEEPYPGQSGDVLFLTCRKHSLLMGAMYAYGLDKAADNTIAAATFSSERSFRFRDMVVKVDTVAISSYVAGMTMKLDQGLEKGAHSAGSIDLQNRAKHTVRLVSGAVELNKYHSALRTAFNNKAAVELEFEWTGELIEEGYYFKLTITLPAVNIVKYPHPVRGRKLELHTFHYEAVYDGTEASEITATLINTISDYPDAT